jgi:hypothetical protein
MRIRERSAWIRVWSSDAMRDKHEVRMSDMRPQCECRAPVAKVDSWAVPTVREKAPSNGHFCTAFTELRASYNSFGDQRCALLTMKSRNTWTRATVFSSSG